MYGRKFTIITDHRPLQWLFNLKEPNSKLIQWRLRLEECDYKIVYKKGSTNTNADFLSRIEANPIEIDKQEDLLSLFNNPGDVAEREEVDLEEIERLLQAGPSLEPQDTQIIAQVPAITPQTEEMEIFEISDAPENPVSIEEFEQEESQHSQEENT